MRFFPCLLFWILGHLCREHFLRLDYDTRDFDLTAQASRCEDIIQSGTHFTPFISPFFKLASSWSDSYTDEEVMIKEL